MSATKYYMKDTDGSAWISVADDTFETDVPMSDVFAIGNCFIQFYDAENGNTVTPTGGTIAFQSSPDVAGDQWLDPPANAVISATDVVAGTAVYTPPSFDSVVVRSRVTLSGITGATHCRAYHWRSEA